MDRAAIAELFAAFGPVDIRRVFSGFGIYADDVCFALFLRDDLYLNADENTIPRFVEVGSEPFSYATATKTVSVKSYWRMPAHLYDDPDELAIWARDAVATATRRKLAKSTKHKSTKSKSIKDKSAKTKSAKRGTSKKSRRRRRRRQPQSQRRKNQLSSPGAVASAAGYRLRKHSNASSVPSPRAP